MCKEHEHRNYSIDLKKDNHREIRDSDILRDPGPQPFLCTTLSRALSSGLASASEPTQSLAETLAFPGHQLPPRKVEGKVSTPCENFTREGNANSCQEKCLHLCILIQPNNGASALQPELCARPRGFRAAPCPQAFGLSAGKDGSYVRSLQNDEHYGRGGSTDSFEEVYPGFQLDQGSGKAFLRRRHIRAPEEELARQSGRRVLSKRKTQVHGLS